MNQRMKGGKHVIIYKSFGPYHIARLKYISRIFPNLLAIAIANNEKNYPWENKSIDNIFCHRILFNGKTLENINILKQLYAAYKLLSAINICTITFSGYSYPIFLIIALWAKIKRKTTICLVDSTLIDKKRKKLKNELKTYLLKVFDKFAVTGIRSKEYMKHLKIRDDKIYEIGNVVDNEFFITEKNRIEKNINDIKEQLMLPSKFFLSIARLTYEKNLHTLIKAHKEYQQAGGTWELVIAGDGKEKEKLIKYAYSINHNKIIFKGWVNYKSIPKLYTLASCFILPSISEPWGLVVNEAMSCGLPLLISNRCGCVPELCKNGKNGFTFNPQDTTQITRLMLYMSSGHANLKEMGNNSIDIIANYTLKSWSKNLSDCIE